MKISLINGFAEIPDGVIVVDLSHGRAADVGVISDKKGELPPLIVVSDKSVRGLSVEEENRVVDEAILEFLQYKETQSQELPCPSINFSKDVWKKWNDEYRLGFFPLAMFEDCSDIEYKLYEEN